MLGRDFMVAPVLEPAVSKVSVYLPAGTWVHVWSGKKYGTAGAGTRLEIDAPLGHPAVFYLATSKHGANFRNRLKAEKLL